MNNNSTEQPTRVFFVRHGVTAQTGTVIYGHTKGLDLSDEGQEQARLLGELLSDIHFDAIFSSPLERAMQTAEAINKGRGLDIGVREEMIDTDVGAWTNFTLKECAELPEWKTVQTSPSKFTFPDGESFKDVLQRMTSAIDTLISENQGKTILVAGHRDPTILLLGSYLGIHMDLFQRIPCKPASVSQVLFVGGIAQVESVNVLPTQRMV